MLGSNLYPSHTFAACLCQCETNAYTAPLGSSRTHPQADSSGPTGHRPNAYSAFAVTVNVVILSMVQSWATVLLVQRAANLYASA